MNYLFPTLPRETFPHLLGMTLVGVLVAGGYGAVHDQITFTISPEYFTKLKFHQFHSANFGWPVRWFVAVVGILATWWVGLIAGWSLARITVPAWPIRRAWSEAGLGFGIMIVVAVIVGFVGNIYGGCATTTPAAWIELGHSLSVSDLPAFIRVAWIHTGSYLGALVGFLLAVVVLLRRRKRIQPQA